MLHVSNVNKNVICVAKQPSVSLWHCWLGHMSQSGVRVLSPFGYVPGFNFLDFSIWEHCLYGKQTQSPHKRGCTKKCEPLELVHSDVCGPMPNMSMGDSKYFVTFIDDLS